MYLNYAPGRGFNSPHFQIYPYLLKFYAFLENLSIPENHFYIRLNFEFWKNSKFSNSFRLQQNEKFWNKHRLCAGEVTSACRFERKARLRLSGWNLAESTALFNCYFRNSTFRLNKYFLFFTVKYLLIKIWIFGGCVNIFWIHSWFMIYNLL